MRMNTIIVFENQAKGFIKSIFVNQLTQEEFQDEWIEYRKKLEERKFPKTRIVYLNGFFDAMLDNNMRQNVVFLYNVDGKLYSCKKDEFPGIPCWDTLPREKWADLSNHGGLYYKGTYKVYY